MGRSRAQLRTVTRTDVRDICVRTRSTNTFTLANTLLRTRAQIHTDLLHLHDVMLSLRLRPDTRRASGILSHGGVSNLYLSVCARVYICVHNVRAIMCMRCLYYHGRAVRVCACARLSTAPLHCSSHSQPQRVASQHPQTEASSTTERGRSSSARNLS